MAGFFSLRGGGNEEPDDAKDFHAFRRKYIHRNDGGFGIWEIDPGEEKSSGFDSSTVEDARVVYGPERPHEVDLPEHQKILVQKYIGLIDRWKSNKTTDNAFKLDETREERAEMLEELKGVLHAKELSKHRKYIAADIADSIPLDMRNEGYSDTITYRTKMREALLGDETHVGAQTYADAIRKTKNIIKGTKDVDLEYDLLDIRRESVQEHFDDPRFIAEIGLYENSHLMDELYFDMDRDDLNTQESQKRSAAVSQVFRSHVEGLNTGNPGETVENYIKLQGMAAEMVDDHGAIIEFAKDTTGAKEGSIANNAAYYNGLAALDPKPAGPGVYEEFYRALVAKHGKLETDQIVRDPVQVFSAAREMFEENIAMPDGGPSNPATSFTIMQQSANRIRSLGPAKINELINPTGGHRDDPGRDAAAFAVFSKEEERRRENADEPNIKEQAAAGFRDEVADQLGTKHVRQERTADENISTTVKTSDGEEIELAIGQKDRVEMRVLDGSHVALTKHHSEFVASDSVSDIKRQTNIDLSDPEVMRRFLSSDHADIVDRFKSANLSEVFGKQGVSGEEFDEMTSRRSATDNAAEVDGLTKSQRIAVAFKLGLGEAVLKSQGLDEEAFKELGEGKMGVDEFQLRAKEAGLLIDKEGTDPDLLDKNLIEVRNRLGLTPEKIKKLSMSGGDGDALRTYRSAFATDASFRLNGIVAPPDNGETMTNDGKVDAGKASKNFHEQIYNKACVGSIDTRNFNFEFEKTKDGRETMLSVKLPDGRYVSDVMLQGGYALPVAGEARNRKEKFAQGAEARGKGLHKHGFPEDDDSWRRDRKCPKLSALDKTERLFATVTSSTAGNPAAARRLLEMKETQLFALPMEEWTNYGNVDREVSKVVKRNPKKVMNIYENNMEILNDLRARHKDGKKLTEDEKIAHDTLSIGRRAMAHALVNSGHMTIEEARKDSHKLLSQRSKLFPEGFRENMRKATEKGLEMGADGVKMSGRAGMKVTQSAVDLVMST